MKKYLPGSVDLKDSQKRSLLSLPMRNQGFAVSGLMSGDGVCWMKNVAWLLRLVSFGWQMRRLMKSSSQRIASNCVLGCAGLICVKVRRRKKLKEAGQGSESWSWRRKVVWMRRELISMAVAQVRKRRRQTERKVCNISNSS